MARSGVAALTSEFDTARLDAIGPWAASADPDNLDITWEWPAALRGGWIPLDLRFHTDSESSSFGPDAGRFGPLEGSPRLRIVRRGVMVLGRSEFRPMASLANRLLAKSSR